MDHEGSPKYVNSAAELKGRILEYQEHAAVLVDRMAFVRAWYAIWLEHKWLFGPSKFIGYKELTAREYLEQAKAGDIDGRDTERHLDRFTALREKESKNGDLYSALDAFCQEYGKKTNTLARISVVDGFGKPLP